MGDFNETIGKDQNMMAQIIAAGNLTNVHANKHGYGKHIAIYMSGKRKVDYCFVSP